MEDIPLNSREYEFNDTSVATLEIDEDPSGLLRGGVGSTVWDTAIVLAKYLERADLLAASSSSVVKVLELGSGTGIVGLAAARMLSAMERNGRVVLTDKDNVVPLLQRNVAKNESKGVVAEARILDWEVISGVKATTSLPKQEEEGEEVQDRSSGSRDEEGTPPDTRDILDGEWDLVILSDCIWVPGLYASLIGTINTVIKPGSKAQLLVAFEKRNFSEEMEFFAMLGKTFRFRDIKPEDQDTNYQSEDIYLFLCQRRE